MPFATNCTRRDCTTDTTRAYQTSAQDEESWISNLKIYRTGDISTITSADAKSFALIAPDYQIDQDMLLFFCTRSSTKSEDRMELLQLVIPELLQQDFSQHYYTSLEEGYQCIGQTNQRIRVTFHWRGLYRSKIVL